MAALLLLERLTPLERAVFVLREVFGFGFGEIAPAVGRPQTVMAAIAALQMSLGGFIQGASGEIDWPIRGMTHWT